MRGRATWATPAETDNKKTKLILIISLITLVRDLPIGLLSMTFIITGSVECLLATRKLSFHVTFLSSLWNVIVFYYTNENFHKTMLSFVRQIFCLKQSTQEERSRDHSLTLEFEKNSVKISIYSSNTLQPLC